MTPPPRRSAGAGRSAARSPRLQARQDDRVAHVSTGVRSWRRRRDRAAGRDWKPVPGFRDRPERLRVEVRRPRARSVGSGKARCRHDGTGIVHARRAARASCSCATAAPRRQRRGRGPLGGAGNRARPERRARSPSATPIVRPRAHHRGVPGAAQRRGRHAQSRPRVPHLGPRGRACRCGRAAGGAAATVTAEVLTREGKVLAAGRPTLVAGQYPSRAPLRSLALGEYVLRFTATPRRRVGGGHDRLRHRAVIAEAAGAATGRLARRAGPRRLPPPRGRRTSAPRGALRGRRSTGRGAAGRPAPVSRALGAAHA